MSKQVAIARATELSDFGIRPARTDDDLAAVDSLWRAVYGQERGWIDPTRPGRLYEDRYHSSSTYLVAWSSGRPVGTMRLVSDSSERLPVQQFFDVEPFVGRGSAIECQRLMVLPDYRRTRDEQSCPFGVFSALIKATLHHCLENRISHVVADLFTDTDTTPMRQLHALGFRQVGDAFVDFELSERSTSVALVLEIADLLSAIFRHKEPFHRYLVAPEDGAGDRASHEAAL